MLYLKEIFIILVLFTLVFCKVDYANAGSCMFCKHEVIVDQSVFESDYFSVILDIEPRVKGHLLVVPKRHIIKAHELSKEEWEELSVVIPRIVKIFSEFLNTDQYIILEKNGPNAFQQVPHVHFHLFPVHSQTWAEIFDIVPKQLSREEIEKEINVFRSYFF
ncbi:MAG: putative HIT-like protein [Chlamydiae bacterium]|nr:putative HIT-like protein [Chlamydiota bacterium]